jgi:YD repeat-containing protein
MLTAATFDAAGRQSGVRHTAGGTESQRFAYSYDNSGRRTSVVEADGDRVTWSSLRQAQGDRAGRVTREQRSGTNAYDTTYTYDAIGSQLTMVRGTAATTYTYNAGDQMAVLRWQ